MVEPDIDPKIYRRKVYEVTARYFNNGLAKELWYKFLQHKLEMSAAAGHEIALKEAALDWFARYSYAYLKDWVFKQEQLPERIRDQPEPSRSWTAVSLGFVLPGFNELVKAGFTIPTILKATVWATLPLRKEACISQGTKIATSASLVSKTGSRKSGWFYMRVVGYLTGYPAHSAEEARQQWSEVLAHRLLSQQSKQSRS